MKKYSEGVNEPYYQRADLKFSCTGCGECCKGGGDYHVFVSDDEAEQIRLLLGVSRAWFAHRYIQRHDDGGLVLSSNAGGACVFLDAGGVCKVYGARPVQCESYPFWPEVVKTAKAWQREARRCEAIGHGDVVAVAYVEKMLAKQREADDAYGKAEEMSS